VQLSDLLLTSKPADRPVRRVGIPALMRLPLPKGIRMTTFDVEHELEQYLETALWSTNADHLDPEGTGAAGQLEDHFEASDIAPDSIAEARRELTELIESAPEASQFWLAELGAGQIGHDFWLTRNGHGAGFWDRFARGVGADFGRQLTELSKPYGTSDAYVGDDGKVHFS
jgi:hypothetical protein